MLDTNVLVSAYFWEGPERIVLKECLSGRHRMITSVPLIDELERVLREKFQVPSHMRTDFLGLIRKVATIVKPDHEIHHVVDDPDDDRVLEAAVTGRAEGIVTGDQHLLRLERFRGIRILPAKRFLERPDELT